MGVKLRICQLTILWSLAYSSGAVASIYGIAGGNPLVSEEFDFNMKLSPKWKYERQELQTTHDSDDWPAETWLLSNQTTSPKQSWMKVEFFSTWKVESLNELKAFLEQREPSKKWATYTDRSLTGFLAEEMKDPEDQTGQATLGRLVYFMDRRMVISISWRRHPELGGSTDISNLIASMDREQSPPIVKSIKMESPSTLKPGDPFCYLIYMDDLKSSFSDYSLKDFSIVGMPEYWIWEDIRWHEDGGFFRVCAKLSARIESSIDLMIQSLEIENERESSVFCKFRVGLALSPLGGFECGERSYGGITYPVSIKIPQVENGNVDREGPSVHGMSVKRSEKQLYLLGETTDQNNIYGGWIRVKKIPGESDNIFIPSWDIKDGHFEADITALDTNGFRRVEEILLLDSEGNSSRYISCVALKAISAKPIDFNCDDHYYAKCTTDNSSAGKCIGTSLKLVEFFSQVKRQN